MVQDSTDSLKKFSLPAIEYLKENNIDVEELIHKFKDYSVVTKANTDFRTNRQKNDS